MQVRVVRRLAVFGEAVPHKQVTVRREPFVLCSFRLDGEQWAVLHLDWSGTQPPWVEALGHWDDVMPTINAHAAGEH